MIAFILFIAIVVWAVRQSYGVRAERWKARGRALVPVGRVLGADARATGHTVFAAFATFRGRRAARGADLDDEWRRLLGERPR